MTVDIIKGRVQFLTTEIEHELDIYCLVVDYCYGYSIQKCRQYYTRSSMLEVPLQFVTTRHQMDMDSIA